jgi:hypothetical protein
MTYAEMLATEVKTLVQKLVVATENLSVCTKDLIKAHKGKTVQGILEVIFSDPMSDAPKQNIGTADEAFYSLSAITSVKKGKKPTALQKDYKAWGKLLDDERAVAETTYYFVKAGASFKANAYRDYERFETGHAKEGQFKFLKNGEPMPRNKAVGTGNSEPTRKVSDIDKHVMTLFNKVRTEGTHDEQVAFRATIIGIYGLLSISKCPIPEITGDVQN